MINFGAVAFDEQGVELGRFSANLQIPEGYIADAATLEWFHTGLDDAYEQGRIFFNIARK